MKVTLKITLSEWAITPFKDVKTNSIPVEEGLKHARGVSYFLLCFQLYFYSSEVEEMTDREKEKWLEDNAKTR